MALNLMNSTVLQLESEAAMCTGQGAIYCKLITKHDEGYGM